MLRRCFWIPFVIAMIAIPLNTGVARADLRAYNECVATTLPKIVKGNDDLPITLTAAQQCAGLLTQPAEDSGKAAKTGSSLGGGVKQQGPTRAQIVKENEARKARNKELAAQFEKKLASFGACAERNSGGSMESRLVRASCGNGPSAPNFEDLADVPGVARQGPPDLGLPPETIGFIATTRLQLPQTSIQLGPDPEWNEWDKAFVGYPYWLWMDSATQPLSSAETVGPVSVGLTARFVSVTYQVKREEPVTCRGSGTPYRRIQSNYGKESPDCGFQFTSKGSKVITATANWSVEWTVNGQRGTLTMPRTASLAVEVGELQSVNVDPPR